MIDISNFELEPRNNTVVYISDEIIIYKQGGFLKVADCDGITKYSFRLKSDTRYFESLDLNEWILILFSGKELVLIDKNEHKHISYEIDTYKLGTVITEIIVGGQKNEKTLKNSIIFGTSSRGGLQIVTYDFLEQKRLNQTSTFKMSKFIDFRCYQNKIYSVLDNTYLVCSDPNTGEILWKRFEVSPIKPKIQFFDDSIIYNCQSHIKCIKNEQVNILKIPFTQITSIEHASKDKIYFTFENKNNLGCYDNRKYFMEWEMKFTDPILQTLYLPSNKNQDLLLMRTENHLTLINLTLKQIIYRTKNKSKKIQKIGNYVLIQRDGQTDIIRGTNA